MKPEFALILSHDGIGLAHRTRAGWARLGEVSLESADMAGELAALRRQAQSLAPKGLLAKLIIPASQILYTAIYAPGPSSAQRRTQIEAALEGMTPYSVSDLVYDWSGNRQTVQIAVVARETLAEAEAFAQSHGFSPICFVAIPALGDFSGEPWFGLSSGAANYLPEGAQVERDSVPLVAFTQETPKVQPATEEAAISVEAVPARPEAQTTPEAEPEPAEILPPVAATDIAPDLAHSDAPVRVETTPAAEDHVPVSAEAEAEAEWTATDGVKLEPVSKADTKGAPEGPSKEALPDFTEAERAAPLVATTAPEPLSTATETVAPHTLPATDRNTDTLGLLDPPEKTSQEDLDDLDTLDLPPSPPITAPERPRNEPLNDELASPDQASDAQQAEPAQSTAKPLSSETIAALAAVSAFSSTRAVKSKDAQSPDATDVSSAKTPKLGGAGRLSPPQPERKKILTGEAGITAPGLDLPLSDPALATPSAIKSRKPVLKKAAKPGLVDTAAIGSAAPPAKMRVTQAGAAIALKAHPKTADKAVDSVPETTVFGAQKRYEVGGKPRYLGASLVGALVLFIALVALWANFLGDDTASAPPEQIAVVAPAALSPDTSSAPVPTIASPAPEAVQPPAIAPPATAPSTPSVNNGAPKAQAPSINESTTSNDTQTAERPQLSPSALPPFDATPLAPPSAPQESVPVAPQPAPPAAPLVTPTPEGVPMPGGFTLFAGKPDLVPGTRPESAAQAWRATQPPAPLRPNDTLAALPELAGFRPASRPSALATTARVTSTPLPATNDPALAQARPVLRPAAISSKVDSAPDDGAALTPAPAGSESRLAGLRPDARPASVQSSAQEAPSVTAPPNGLFANASPLAVATSARPPSKPRNFARSVESALAAAIAAQPTPSRTTVAAPKAVAVRAPPEEIDEPEPVKPAPRLPTSASVARQATEKNVINLRQINLIGLYGSSSNRRALVRLKNGKFVKVGVGDRLDGGKVSAIGSTQLTYVKRSRSYTLQLP